MAANDLFRTTQEHPPVGSGTPYYADDLEQVGGEVSSRPKVGGQSNACKFETARFQPDLHHQKETDMSTSTIPHGVVYIVQKYVTKRDGNKEWMECEDFGDGFRFHFDLGDAKYSCRDFMEDYPDEKYRVRAWDCVNERTLYSETDKAEEDANR